MLVLDAEPVNDAPILDLRLRKGVRRHGLKLAVASPHASSLDANAALSVRYAPGAAPRSPRRSRPRCGQRPTPSSWRATAGAEPDAVRELAALLSGADAERRGCR